jgi:hypothetical protein
MPGLDPGIHSVTSQQAEAPMEWIAGSSPAMTTHWIFYYAQRAGLAGSW